MEAIKSNIKSFMGIGFRPVYLAVAIEDSKIFGVTVTSLVSTSARDGSEEVAFVLRNTSSFIRKIQELSAFSIYLLGVDQLELALECSRLDKRDDVIKKFFHLDKVSKNLRLRNYCGLLDLRIRSLNVRGDNFLVLASVESTLINNNLPSTAPLMYGFGKFQEEQRNK